MLIQLLIFKFSINTHSWHGHDYNIVTWNIDFWDAVHFYRNFSFIGPQSAESQRKLSIHNEKRTIQDLRYLNLLSVTHHVYLLFA